MTLFTLYVEKSVAPNNVLWETIAKGVTLQKAERRRQELEKLGKHCARQQYRGETMK